MASKGNLFQTRWIFRVATCAAMVVLVTWNMHISQRVKFLESSLEEGNEGNIDQTEKGEDPANAVDKKRIKRGVTTENSRRSAKNNGGALYTRWGRTTCGSRSELVYAGIAGGSHYSHIGGASNYVCLPKDPIWNKDGGCGARMYGAEYQEDNQFASDNFKGKFFNHNVPCAVCRSADRATTLMIPARNICHAGWTLEYQGYLMTGHYGHKNNYDYVCVDEAPEADPAGYRDEDGAMFYAVSAGCGSLPCPPYADGKKLTCAVCTK